MRTGRCVLVVRRGVGQLRHGLPSSWAKGSVYTPVPDPTAGGGVWSGHGRAQPREGSGHGRHLQAACSRLSPALPCCAPAVLSPKAQEGGSLHNCGFFLTLFVNNRTKPFSARLKERIC